METGMNLQKKLDAMKQEAIATKPPEIMRPLQEETKKLVESGVADKAIKVGDRLPDFSLTDTNGNVVSSQEVLAQGPLALSFYRGIW